MQLVVDIRQHEGWCPHGQPPDGRLRLDMFPEYGGAFPVWEKGVGRADLAISDLLRASLYGWNSIWERHANPGGDATHMWRADWIADGERLATQLSCEVDAVVLVLGPERFGPDPTCTSCGPNAEPRPPDVADQIASGFVQSRAYLKRAQRSWKAGDFDGARADLKLARSWLKRLGKLTRDEHS